MDYSTPRFAPTIFNTTICGFFLLLLALVQGSFAAQQFEKQPEYFEVNPGQESRLICKIFNKKGQCSWQKDNKPVGIYLGKYEWSGNPDTGDCSIRILNAALEYDDGEWECQVTASDFTTQDALTSNPVKLVVRVPPNAPQIEFNATAVPMGKNITSQSKKKSTVKCISRYGNPPPLLKWFVGDEEVVGINQTNRKEEDNPKKWVSTSILEYAFLKTHNGKSLRCVAIHEAYPSKSRETQVVLDIQYGPVVKLQGIPELNLEEHKNHVAVNCLVDSNPPASIIWRKTGSLQIYSLKEILELKPLQRKHTGSYYCEAKNFLGTAITPNVDVDVKYPPKIMKITPEGKSQSTLYNRTILQCQAEGNPAPTYQWLQKVTNEAEENVYVRGVEQTLVINNITYDYQGLYVCKATNFIAGVERNVVSDPVQVNVLGAPQIQRHFIEREVEVEKNSNAMISMIFCSNPAHTKAVWEWGSIKLETGSQMTRFRADAIVKIARKDCYEAKLHIAQADNSDSRHYYLNIENDHGVDKYSVNLQVRDPVSMATVVGTIVVCLVLLVVVVLVILYAFKSEKMCFAQRGDFKPTDLESEKSDLDTLGNIHTNGNIDFATIPQTELHFSHHQFKRSRPPDNPSDFHILKQQRNENFRARDYPIDYKQDINYSDLQLPRTSNNGSMKKSNKTYHHYQQHYQQQNHPSSIPRRLNFAEIQFKPKVNEQADV